MKIDKDSKGLKKNLTISCKFSYRQGEVKLLDYQTQQYRLFPEIAKTYAFYFAGVYLRKIYKEISAQVKQGDTDLLPEVI